MGKKKKQKKPEKQDKLKKGGQKAEKSDKKDRHIKSQTKEKDTAAKKPEPKTESAVAKRPGSKTGAGKGRHPAGANGDMAAVMRAFVDPNRLQILDLLKERELSAGELLGSLDIVQSTLSHHMKLLVETGIVTCRKQGKWSYYSINRARLAEVGEYIRKWS